MSKAPLLPLAVTETRLPFTRWRCLWDPYVAVDKEQCEPFATLTVVVDKAVGLSSPDFNGLADPYVTLCLNGEEKVQKSKTQSQTLAPRWNETFTIDIYHPVSVVTVTVFDQEYGDSDFADFFHLDDVLSGWVDLRTGAMPMGEWMSGWFDLGNPEHYKDTITGRLENPNPEGHSGCGRIHLKMRLSTTHPHDELFAMCLPLPDCGHSCHLDLADLIHDVVSLSKAMDKWQNEIWADFEWLLHHATPVYVLAMVMIWYPTTTLPCLSVLIPLALVYISSAFSEPAKAVPVGLGGGVRKDKKDKEEKKEDKEKKETPVKVVVPVKAVRRTTEVVAIEDGGGKPRRKPSDWKVKALSRNEPADLCVAGPKKALLSSVASESPKAPDSSRKSLVVVQDKAPESPKAKPKAKPQKAPELSDKQQKEQEAQQQAEETEQKLKMMVNWMPKHAAKELRKTAADMENLVQLVEVFENLGALRAGYGTRFLVNCAVVGGVSTAAALQYFSNYQELLIQITLTIVVSVNLWEYSCPGRLVSGFYYYFLTHWRIRSRFVHGFDDDHETTEMRVLARAHVKHLGLQAKGKIHEDHIDLHGHHFDLTTFKKMAYCDDCGGFLWGVKEQGFHCKACDRTVCPNCAHSDADGAECPGACREHDFAPASFHHATWCHKCDTFLWGVKNQGSQCKNCQLIVCRKCVKIQVAKTPSARAIAPV